jgi:hypothetical protein
VFGTFGLLEVSADSYHGLEDSIAGHTRKNFPSHCDYATGKKDAIWLLLDFGSINFDYYMLST